MAMNSVCSFFAHPVQSCMTDATDPSMRLLAGDNDDIQSLNVVITWTGHRRISSWDDGSLM